MYYRGYYIIRDLAGDGWNILQDGHIIDEGYGSIGSAIIAIDKFVEMEE